MVRIAVVGCGHGELNKIYGSLGGTTVDLIIICGDFQALRNVPDLETISVPNKYKQLGDFHEYYSGARRAPVLTIFIGGNHECSSYLKELKYGGFVAPNIYYLGDFGCVLYMGLRISGQSGVWYEPSFMKSTESESTLPYDLSTLRTIYHTKASTFLKSYLLHSHSQYLDISLSHDWPQDIVYAGNLQQLLKYKPFFRQDIESGKLGNPLAKILLKRLKPRYWFAGHLHVRFTATVNHEIKRNLAEGSHGNNKRIKSDNQEEIELDMDDDTTGAKPETQSQTEESKNDEEIELDMDDGFTSSKKAVSQDIPDILSTSFLALDKCVQRRKFMEYVTIDPLIPPAILGDRNLYHDKRAVAINKVVDMFVSTNRAWPKVTKNQLLSIDTSLTGMIGELEEEIEYELQKLEALPLENFIIDQNKFKVIAPVHGSSDIPLKYWENNQTCDYVSSFLK